MSRTHDQFDNENECQREHRMAIRAAAVRELLRRGMAATKTPRLARSK